MKKTAVFCAAVALAAVLAACSDGGSSGSAGGTSLSERLAKDGEEVSLGDYQLEKEATYTVTGRNVTVSGGNADGAAFVVKAEGVRFSNVRGVGSLVVDSEVGEGDFSAEGCEVSTMLVNGGGTNSVHIVGGKMGDILVLKETVRIALEGTFEKAVKGIYSLAGEFKGKIDTKDASGLKIEKADAKIAAKAEGADIEDKNASVPPEVLKAALAHGSETVDILSGRAFMEMEEDEEDGKVSYCYYFFKDGTLCYFDGKDEKTFSQIEEAAGNITNPYNKCTYKIFGEKMEIPEMKLESGEIISKMSCVLTVKDGGISIEYPAYDCKISDGGCGFFDISLPDFALGYFHLDNDEYHTSYSLVMRGTPGQSGTIPFTMQKLQENNDDGPAKFISAQDVTAHYTVIGGDIGSKGSTMELKIVVGDKEITASGTLGTENIKMTEVTK